MELKVRKHTHICIHTEENAGRYYEKHFFIFRVPENA
jgi:hypothetical protein